MQGQCTAGCAHQLSHRRLGHQLVAFEQLQQGPFGLADVQCRLCHMLQHLGQAQLQGRNALLHAHQFGVHLGFLGFFLGHQLALADVGHAAYHAQGLALGIADHKAPVQHPEVVAVFMADAVFALPGVAAALHGGLQRGHHTLAVFGVQACNEGIGVGHLGVVRQTQHFAKAPTPPQGVGAHIPVPHRVGGGACHQGQALFGNAQGLGRILYLRRGGWWWLIQSVGHGLLTHPSARCHRRKGPA